MKKISEKPNEFMARLVDFKHLQGKSQEDIAKWANEMWAELKDSPYWSQPEYYKYTSTFLRYMGRYIPEVQDKIAESMSIEVQQAGPSA